MTDVGGSEYRSGGRGTERQHYRSKPISSRMSSITGLAIYIDWRKQNRTSHRESDGVGGGGGGAFSEGGASGGGTPHSGTPFGLGIRLGSHSASFSALSRCLKAPIVIRNVFCKEKEKKSDARNTLP